MNFSHELFTTSNPNPYSNTTNNNAVTSSLYLTVSTVNAVLGLHVHFYVLWLICKGKGITAEFFYFNLALCEILNSLGSLSYILTLWVPSFSNGTLFLAALPFFGRPMIQCLICIERYLAVLHPVSFLKYKPLRYRLPCCAVVWATILGFAAFCKLIVGSGKWNIFLCVFLPVYVFLFIINVSCSVAILKALKQPNVGQKGNDRVQGSKIKRKAINFILVITVGMFIQSVPLYIAGILFTTLPPADFMFYFAISMTIMMMMAYLSPILYIYRVKKG